ncbi:MAG TPA: hypothetical protein VF316_04490, partial [Polyangiaceae bacterium]
DVRVDATTEGGDAQGGGDGESGAGCTAGDACVPPLPVGWSWVAYDQSARPSCATGFTTPRDVNEGLVAPPATCGCGCTTTSPTCTGKLKITAGTSGGNGCQDKANQMESSGSGCQTLSPSINANGWSVNAKAPAPSGGSCSANPSVSRAAVSYGFQGRTCALAASAGAACGGGDVCVPKAAPFAMCVARTGDAACPTGYPAKHLTGSVVADTRACSTCTCSFTQGVCGGTLTLYGDKACTVGAAPVTVDETCRLVANKLYTAFTYAPQPTASCTGSAVAATGSATFADLQTVCCVGG